MLHTQTDEKEVYDNKKKINRKKKMAWLFPFDWIVTSKHRNLIQVSVPPPSHTATGKAAIFKVLSHLECSDSHCTFYRVPVHVSLVLLVAAVVDMMIQPYRQDRVNLWISEAHPLLSLLQAFRHDKSRQRSQCNVNEYTGNTWKCGNGEKKKGNKSIIIQ